MTLATQDEIRERTLQLIHRTPLEIIERIVLAASALAANQVVPGVSEEWRELRDALALCGVNTNYEEPYAADATILMRLIRAHTANNRAHGLGTTINDCTACAALRRQIEGDHDQH